MTSSPFGLGQALDAPALTERLRQLRDARRRPSARKTQRQRLTRADRATIAAKTDGRCHICGGVLDAAWEADHVMAHSAGGSSRLDNYLPAHSLCNNYRWNYSPEEFQWVLKIGVWARLVMEQDGPVVQQMAKQFCATEYRRIRRRKV